MYTSSVYLKKKERKRNINITTDKKRGRERNIFKDNV